MVSQKTIKSLDFNNIYDYFEYVHLSEVNGNRSQVHSLINKMSKQQKKDFLAYISNIGGTDAEIVRNIVITSM